ncbi:NUDIX hydrolase [Alkalicoccus chagannorensis]|uniref:NUDIX hydrolase n=1 Tax=Alkalicoccus chagannorensis TaxID=427072 RepID=UPI0004177F2D|nr:CoA pyrophosphatase [Alkalicoccus chagannorensis]
MDYTQLQQMRRYFQEREAGVMDAAKRFALFVPIKKIDGVPHVVFEVRSQHVPQPGEICFPGGSIDRTDAGAEAAAVRELCEETGVDASAVSTYGELDYIVTPAKGMIRTFIGEIDPEALFSPNLDEVDHLFTVPVEQLLAAEPKTHPIHLEVKPPEDFPYHLIPHGKNYPWGRGSIQEVFYEADNYIIWGLTARVLYHALKEMEKALVR